MIYGFSETKKKFRGSKETNNYFSSIMEWGKRRGLKLE
jgi:hypothetical protein